MKETHRVDYVQPAFSFNGAFDNLFSAFAVFMIFFPQPVVAYFALQRSQGQLSAVGCLGNMIVVAGERVGNDLFLERCHAMETYGTAALSSSVNC